MHQRRQEPQRESHALRTIVGAITAGVAIFALVGCSPDPSGQPGVSASAAESAASTAATQPQAATSSAPSATADPSASAAPTNEADPAVPPTAAPDLPVVEAAMTESAPLETGVTVKLDGLEPLTVEPGTPGEVPGPAVRVNVRVTNNTEYAVNVDSAVVTLSAGAGSSDEEPGIATTAGDPKPLAGPVAPGAEATGSYVFMLEQASGRELSVSVNYAAGQPLAVFTGSIN